jgi:hypothetical protein
MLVHNHSTDGRVTSPSLALVEEAWTTDVVPRVPANLAEQARVLQAFQRVRGLAPPTICGAVCWRLCWGLWRPAASGRGRD